MDRTASKITDALVLMSDTPNVGEDDSFAHVCAYSDSILSGLPRAKEVGWVGKCYTITILFDLKQDYRLERITINAPDEKDTMSPQLFTVACRPDGEGHYQVAAHQLMPTEKNLNSFDLELHGAARFVKIQFRHSYHSIWRQMPVPVICLYGTATEKTQRIAFTEEQLRGEIEREACAVDIYGQCEYLEWENKIRCDADFQKYSSNEEKMLKNVEFDLQKYDKYGGLLEKSVESTGYFTLQKINGVWWFITPLGHPFLIKGVDLVTYSEMSYQTPLYQPGTHNLREAFSSLPDRESLPEAYEMYAGKVPSVNFLKANLVRKYGRDFSLKWAETTRKRLIHWDFNTASKWDLDKNIRMPYVVSLGSGSGYQQIKWALDPFDVDFEQCVDKDISETLLQKKDDDMLIGYHFTNESGWNSEIVREAAASDSKLPAKRAFVMYFAARYADNLNVINKLLHTDVSSMEALYDIPLNLEHLPKADISGFITLASQTYFSKVQKRIRHWDPNHLFLGSAVGPDDWQSSYEWIVGSADYVDAISVDCYANDDGAFMYPYLFLDKPILNLEYSFTAGDRGHGTAFDGVNCETQVIRGEKYARFTAAMAALPQFVGSGFFILYDQPITGRAGDDGSWGEAYNFGLLDTQDQEYTDFCSAVKKANSQLEKIHSGKK